MRWFEYIEGPQEIQLSQHLAAAAATGNRLCLLRCRQVRPDGQQVHKLLLLASALVDLLTAVAQPQPLGRWHAAVDPGGVCHLGKQASNQAQVVPLLLSVAVVAAAKVEDHHDRKHRKLLCKQAYTCTNLLRKHSNRVCN